MQSSFRSRGWIVSVVLMALVLSVSGCASTSTPTSPTTPTTPPPPASIVIAQAADAISLDPQKQSDTNTGNIVHNIFDGLLLRDKDMAIQPALATAYKQINDTQWELTLRQNVKFQNGEEFNADAVKFTLDRIKDPNTKALQASFFTIIKEVEIIDPYTVRFTTNSADLLFPARMTNLLILPPKYFKEKGDDFVAKNPVGTGPYKFVEWVKDDRVVVEAYPEHWRGKPAIAKVTWRPVPEMATRIAGLQGGQIDILSAVPADQIKAIESNKNLKAVSTASAQIQMLNFNPNVAPADNKNFRLAVAHAVNPKIIMEALLGEFATPLDIPVSSIIPGIPTGIKPLAYDPAKAKALLAEAGLNSVTIDFNSQNGTYPLDKDIAQAIAQQLAAVGITANVKPTEAATFTGLLQSKKMSPLYLMGGNNIWFDVDPQITAFYNSTGPLATFNNKDLDALIVKARSLKNQTERTAAYAEAYTMLRDEGAGVPILQYKLVAAINTRVDWKPRADGRIRILEITVK